MLIERTILKQIVVMPNEKIIQVQWATQILRDDAVVSETFTRRAYASNDQAAFMAEVENSAAYVAAAGWAPLSSAPPEPARYSSTPSPPPEPTPNAVVSEEPAPEPAPLPSLEEQAAAGDELFADADMDEDRLSFEELSSRGIMIVEDELVVRRGLAWASVSDHADALVAAIIDPNRRTELIAQVAMAANKRQLGLQLDESDIEAESRFVALQAREDEIRRFERQMREAVRFASVDMLRDFNVEGAGWPT